MKMTVQTQINMCSLKICLKLKEGGGEEKLVFYAKPATEVISWQGSQTCKQMPSAEKEQCA